ncbi:hypothetical protein RUND412_000302 [Rhizina undulata]
MPTPRQKAITASNETRAMLPDIPARSGTNAVSLFYRFTTQLPPLPGNSRYTLRSAVMLGCPLDIAADWQNYSFPQTIPASRRPGTAENDFPFPPSTASGHGTPIPANSEHKRKAGNRAPPVYYKSILQGPPTNRVLVLNTSNEKKPAGDWDGGVLGGEEAIARRSNLVQALTTTDPRDPNILTYYPLPQTGGIYSPNVVIFRDGPDDDYAIRRDENWTAVSIVSVSAVKRPKLDESGLRYSFDEERNLQQEKMKTILRIAALQGHVNLVLGGFGSCGHGGNGGAYRNPIRDVCILWKELLLEDEEFKGWFANVVFVVGGGGVNTAKEDAKSVEEFSKYFG